MREVSWEAIVARLPEPVARLVRELAELCQHAGLRSYLVGGVVRDFLLGRPLREADVVVVGDAAWVAQQVARRTQAAVVVFPNFGTARLVLDGAALDVAPARTELYPRPGALPQVQAAGSIEEDLWRRDFTVNALAVPLSSDDRALIDPWGGLRDLREGWLRALHERSFEDDPTRLVRAIRFSVRYGLTVEPRTRRWMRQAVAQRALDRVSAQRRGTELRRAMQERPVLPVADAMQRWGLWDALCPGWALSARARRVLARLDADEAPLDARERVALMAVAEGWLARQRERVAGQVEELDRRLALTRAERRALEQLPEARRAAGVLARDGRLKPSTVDRYLRPLTSQPVLGWLAEACGGPGSAGYRWVRWYVEVGCRIRPSLTGRDLERLGVPAGRAMGQLLEALRRAILDGRIHHRAEEVAWVQRRLPYLRHRPAPGGSKPARLFPKG